MTSNKVTNWDDGKFHKKTRITEQDKQNIADYYEASLNVNKSRDELIRELGEKYHRSPRQIERYIEDSRGKAGKASQIEPEKILSNSEEITSKSTTSPKPEDFFMSNRTQEHQDSMMRLVYRIKNELDPPMSDFVIYKKGWVEGHSRLGQNSSYKMLYPLCCQYDDNSSLCLKYELETEVDPETTIIFSYLQQHIRSSPFSWILDDNETGIQKWKYLGGKELECRERLLQDIDREIEKRTGEPINDLSLMKDMKIMGPSTLFSLSIRSTILDESYGYSGHAVESGDNSLFKIQYGSETIGLTDNDKEGAQYVKWHKELIAEYARNNLVKEIGRLAEERAVVTKSIQDALTQFVVDKYLPGKCNYKFCR
jgi:hypothetical protein